MNDLDPSLAGLDGMDFDRDNSNVIDFFQIPGSTIDL